MLDAIFQVLRVPHKISKIGKTKCNYGKLKSFKSNANKGVAKGKNMKEKCGHLDVGP